MMNRSNIVIAGSSVLVAAAVVWGASSIADAIRETHRWTPAEQDADAVQARTAAAPVRASQEERTRTEPRAPNDASPPSSKIIISHDIFERRWKNEGLAAEARTRCWSKLEGAPASVSYLVTVAEDGSVAEVEAADLRERAGTEPLQELHECLAELVRTIHFEPGLGASSGIQINRDW
jgi:hypothetical protein